MRVIGDIARLNAKRFPEKTALIMDGKSITYRQLDKKINMIAHGMISLGAKPGDRVAFLAYNDLDYIPVSYAAAKCGLILVPVNFRYKKDELVFLMNNCKADILIYGPEFAPMVNQAIPEFENRIQGVVLSGEPAGSSMTLDELIKGKPDSEPLVEVTPDMPVMITYTSGTTGTPKGVLASHENILSVSIAMVIEGDVQPNEVVLVCMPLFHTGGFQALAQPALIRGGTVLLFGKGFDADKILGAVEKHKVTLTMWVPTMLVMLTNHPAAEKYNVSTLKKIWYGSSPITPSLLAQCYKIFNAQFYQWYGQTETGMISILQPEDHKDRGQCTGREIFRADLRIVDRNNEDVQVGEVGEIISFQKFFGMMGYWQSPRKNEETVRNGWIHTGDLARNDGDGYFTIVDRMGDMIISGAENIYPREVENAISRHHGVLEVAVFGIPDEVYGESVCAAVVPRTGFILNEQDIIEYCGETISSYKKPKKVIFCQTLPKTANGKVRKNIIKNQYLSRE